MSTGIMVPAPPFVSPKATVQAAPATATLTTSIAGKNVTNTGSTATSVLTLPSAASMAGQSVRFQQTAAQINQITPASGEKIYLGGSGVADKYLGQAGVIGDYLEIYSDGVDWLCIAYSGVVTKEA